MNDEQGRDEFYVPTPEEVERAAAEREQSRGTAIESEVLDVPEDVGEAKSVLARGVRSVSIPADVERRYVAGRRTTTRWDQASPEERAEAGRRMQQRRAETQQRRAQEEYRRARAEADRGTAPPAAPVDWNQPPQDSQAAVALPAPQPTQNEDLAAKRRAAARKAAKTRAANRQARESAEAEALAAEEQARERRREAAKKAAATRAANRLVERQVNSAEEPAASAVVPAVGPGPGENLEVGDSASAGSRSVATATLADEPASCDHPAQQDTHNIDETAPRAGCLRAAGMLGIVLLVGLAIFVVYRA